MPSVIYNSIGFLGVFFCLLAFLLIQMQRLDPKGLTYSILNLLGGGGILFSLFFEWNLSAALIEGAWVLISLYGIVAYCLRKRKASRV